MLNSKYKESQLKKLEYKRNNTLNMIIYFENEIRTMNNKHNSFPNEEQFNKYLESLKANLIKQHEKLIEIIKKIDSIKGV